MWTCTAALRAGTRSCSEPARPPGRIRTRRGSPRRLHRVFPSLDAGYRAAIGRPLGWRTLVRSEQLCFTRDFLPNVGTAGRHGKVLYVQALGGHGIALGTLLGKAAAERIWSVITGVPEQEGLFDVFAAVPHGWLPAWPPARKSVAAMGLRLHEWGLA
jgi:hypothetical protein